MPLSDPLLPSEYVQKVLSHDMMQDFKTSVFDSGAHEFRVQMRRWIKPGSPDSFFAFRDSSEGFSTEARRTRLHFFAMDGDVLCTSELITCGATPDKADRHGITPLHLVGQEMIKVKNPLVTLSKADGSGMTDKKRLYMQLAWVARILVEQHANVNIVIQNDSLLNLVCTWKDWDLIALLLKHGATPSPRSASRFTTSTDKKRFLDLAKTYGSGARPARICPCWSGKTVPECHGKGALPYPLKYMCVCGSTKTYERCCHKRGKFVSEKWDPASQRNLLTYDDVHPIPPIFQHTLAVTLLSRGLIDPAFGYAMGKTEFLPLYVHDLFCDTSSSTATYSPHRRTTSRSVRVDMQTVWNKHVDDYIAQGTDSHSKGEIERKAKVGAGNGALFRICEAERCQKVESSEEKFSLCAKCKTVSSHLLYYRKVMQY
jgi:hypothetical protein